MTITLGGSGYRAKTRIKMSFVQVMSHSGGGLGSDRTPFYGIRLPAEVKSMIKLCKSIEHSKMREILKGELANCVAS